MSDSDLEELVGLGNEGEGPSVGVHRLRVVSYLLPEPVVVEVRLDKTWSEVLNENLGLKVDPGSELFVCSSNFKQTGPYSGKGAKSGLNDTVGHYLDQFTRPRSQNTVRIMFPRRSLLSFHDNESNESGTPHAGSSNGTSGQRLQNVVRGPRHNRFSGVVPSTSKASIFVGNNTPNRTQSGLKRTTANESQPSGHKKKKIDVRPVGEAQPIPVNLEMEEAFWNVPNEDEGNNSSTTGSYSDDDFDDTKTTASEEELELTRQGIQVQDVKSIVTRRLAGFSNGLMLRVKKEIENLKKRDEGKQWQKHLTRTPLAAHFLNELFNNE